MVDPIVPPAQGPSAVAPSPGPVAPGRPVVLPDGWTVTVTDKIVTTVDKVRSKTTAPITLIARGIVYGLLVAAAAGVAIVVGLALVMRLLVVGVDLIPGINDRPGRSVWIVDLVIGLALLFLGSRIMRKGRIPRADADTA